MAAFMSRLMIYEATGHTGKLVARQAHAAGLNFVIGGRDAVKLRDLSAELDVDFNTFDLDDPSIVWKNLYGFSIYLNCAGLFVRTAEPLISGCIATGMHYLDINAEINVFRLAEELADEAAAARIMLLQGVGWDVVPTDCLAALTVQRVQKRQRLRIALR
jgi:short subunit dehydrogenase-like uncharacterized protein